MLCQGTALPLSYGEIAGGSRTRDMVTLDLRFRRVSKGFGRDDGTGSTEDNRPASGPNLGLAAGRACVEPRAFFLSYHVLRRRRESNSRLPALGRALYQITLDIRLGRRKSAWSREGESNSHGPLVRRGLGPPRLPLFSPSRGGRWSWIRTSGERRPSAV